MTFFANDSKGYLTMNSIIIQKDMVAPIITLNSPMPNQLCGKIPPDFSISIIEENLFSTWYTIEGIAGKFYFTELNGTINQEAWENIIEGEVIITFYAQDRAGNIETESVVVIKRIPSKPAIPFVIILITIISAVAGIGVAATVIFLLRKRKRASESI